MENPVVLYDPEFAKKSEELAFGDVDYIVEYYSRLIAQYGNTKWYEFEIEDGPEESNLNMTEPNPVSNSDYRIHFRTNFIPRASNHVGMGEVVDYGMVYMDPKSLTVSLGILSIVNDIFRKMPMALEAAVSKIGNTDELTRKTEIADEEFNSRLALMDININKPNQEGGACTVLVAQTTLVNSEENKLNCFESIQLTYNSMGVPVGFEYATNYWHNISVEVPFAVGYLKGEYSFILAGDKPLRTNLPRFDYRYMQIAVARVFELVDFLHKDGKKTD